MLSLQCRLSDILSTTLSLKNEYISNHPFMLLQHELMKSNNDIFQNGIHGIMFTALRMFNEMLGVMKRLQNYIEGIELKLKA